MKTEENKSEIMETSRNKNVESKSVCTTCHGTGNVTCDMCKGSGRNESGQTCNICSGTGRVKCPVCKGDGAGEVMN